MKSNILNNSQYMNWLEKLDEATLRKVLTVLPGSPFEKAEVMKRIRWKQRNRIIIHIPHASLAVPEEFQKRLLIDEEEFEKENIFESDYLIDVFCSEDLDHLIFPYSRMFCDVERFRDDRKEHMAMFYQRGVVYEKDARKRSFIQINETYKKHILEDYYDPHHKTLTDKVKEKILSYGECLIIDLHSYSDFYEGTLGKRISETSPDICIGFNDYELAKDAIETIQRLCAKYGYTNILNVPYSGSIVPIDYINDKRAKSVMLEVNKRIYLNDEMNGLDENKAAEFDSFMKELYRKL